MFASFAVCRLLSLRHFFAHSVVESDLDSSSQTLLESDVDPLVVGILFCSSDVVVLLALLLLLLSLFLLLFLMFSCLTKRS